LLVIFITAKNAITNWENESDESSNTNTSASAIIEDKSIISHAGNESTSLLNAENTGAPFSKDDAKRQLEYLIHDIYKDEDIFNKFEFKEADSFFGFEGLGGKTGDITFTTVILELTSVTKDGNKYIFWHHERHYLHDGVHEDEFTHDVTINFYVIYKDTKEIIPERVYDKTGDFKLNEKFDNSDAVYLWNE
jgi:hypothetical protein